VIKRTGNFRVGDTVRRRGFTIPGVITDITDSSWIKMRWAVKAKGHAEYHHPAELEKIE